MIKKPKARRPLNNSERMFIQQLPMKNIHKEPKEQSKRKI
jgi:hypothetical protein